MKALIFTSIFLFSLSGFADSKKEIKLPTFSKEIMKQGETQPKKVENCISRNDPSTNTNSVSCSSNKNISTDQQVQGYTGETSSFMQTEMQNYRQSPNQN
jgi:hypothetical protein